MRRKTQTEGRHVRPTLCHASANGPGGGARASTSGKCEDDNFSARAQSKTIGEPLPGRQSKAFGDASTRGTTRTIGDAFETRALEFLQRQRLRLVARNVTCRGGEIDLVMRDRDGSLVFVEVRARMRRQYGGAAASVGAGKRRRLIGAAQFYLATRVNEVPACRFDVIAFEAGRLVWLRDAFRADDL